MTGDRNHEPGGAHQAGAGEELALDREIVTKVESVRGRTLNAVVGLGVLIAFFIAVNVLAGPWLGRLRLDLTADERYTLSDGTKLILSDIGRRGPSRLTLYYSRESAAGRPAIQAYASRIDELLQEFELAAGGGFRVERIDPKPFSSEETRAQAAGIAALPIGTDGQPIFLGIEAAGPTDIRGVIPFLDPEQEPFLEYELAKLLVSVRSPLRPAVGVVSSLPLQRGPNNRPWLIWQELSMRFEVRDLGYDFDTIDPAVRALVLVHPKGLSESALLAIDQAALSGTPVVVLFDPVCELERPSGNESNPMLAFQQSRASDLGGLLTEWGVHIDPKRVVGDLNLAARVRSRGQVVPYLPYLQLDGSRFNQSDPVTRQIDSMILASAGAIDKTPASSVTIESLITTTDSTMLIDSQQINPMTDPRELADSFVSRGVPSTLAARVTGTVESAFASPPSRTEPNEEWQAPRLNSGEIDVTIIADADLLADQFWLEEVGVGGASIGYRRISANGDLVLNAIELAAGDRALLSLRGRGVTSRPFTRIEALQRRADEQFSQELKALEAERDRVEEQIRLAQLGEADQDSEFSDQLILTPEQAQRVERFRTKLIETNRRLRDVRFNLNEDVDRLEAWIKTINVAVGPLLVMLAASAIYIVRKTRSAYGETRSSL